MIQFLISRLVKTPPDGSAEAALSFEGMRVDWALLIFAVLAVLAFIAYRWGAPEMSKGRRTVLAALRILLVGLFLLLLVKPVLLVTLNEPVRERLLVVVDTTQSMEIKDRRRAEDDQKRAALAAGLLLPKPRLWAKLELFLIMLLKFLFLTMMSCSA